MLPAPDVIPTYMTGYTPDRIAGAWPQQVKFTLLGYIFVRVVLIWTFIMYLIINATKVLHTSWVVHPRLWDLTLPGPSVTV